MGLGLATRLAGVGFRVYVGFRVCVGFRDIWRCIYGCLGLWPLKISP